MSAQRCRDIRQYLRKPNELFRRVRDEHGQLHLSKRAAAYHPGQGVYRSSYKNARRLAVTETNMAYNTSDHLRWQQLDFVVGIEVRLSGNHTCLGGDGKPHEFTDICDELAGKYPKTFKFAGWHPQCRCIAISILKTQEEIDADTQKILNGEPIDGGSVNKVEDVPQAFKDWCAENSDRIDRAAERGTLPYFLRDNRGYMDKKISSEADKKTGALGGNKFGRNEQKEAHKLLQSHQETHNYTQQQIENHKEVAKVFETKIGKYKSFDEADHGRSNLDKDKENCPECVFAHELRLRGFDVTAKPYAENDLFNALSRNTKSVWLTKEGKEPQFTALIGGDNKDVIISKLKKCTQEKCRYHLGWETDKYHITKEGKKEYDGHVITLERIGDVFVLYCPQEDYYYSVGEIFGLMRENSKLELLRVDNLLINTKTVKNFVRVFH
ncbi:MAG: hypothetical protein II752_06870 [Muribaculaceae bacterium]|nr:hypothetical protein [Muribaculaceae bacterium]